MAENSAGGTKAPAVDPAAHQPFGVGITETERPAGIFRQLPAGLLEAGFFNSAQHRVDQAGSGPFPGLLHHLHRLVDGRPQGDSGKKQNLIGAQSERHPDFPVQPFQRQLDQRAQVPVQTILLPQDSVDQFGGQPVVGRVEPTDRIGMQHVDGDPAALLNFHQDAKGGQPRR